MAEILNFPSNLQTVPEKLRALADAAESDPELFRHFVILWEDKHGRRGSSQDDEITVALSIYMVEQYKFDLMKHM